jgi:hypothetical protein
MIHQAQPAGKPHGPHCRTDPQAACSNCWKLFHSPPPVVNGKPRSNCKPSVQKPSPEPETPLPSSSDWPEPKPLPDILSPVDPFDYSLLPKAFRGFVEDNAERMQAPPDFAAIAMMLTEAAAIGNKVCIRPKRHDDWLVSPNMWGFGVGRPGIMKTPSVREPLKVLQTLEIEAKKKFDKEMMEFMVRAAIGEAKKKVQAKAIKEAIENEQDPREAAKAAEVEEEKPPTMRRFICNDSTVEKHGVIMAENPSGVMVFRDELVGLLENLDKEGQEGARAFYLESWDGLGSFTWDRIARGTIYIPKCCLTMLGTIQPGRLLGYLAEAVECGKADDGLLQRFQLAIYPDVSREWKNVDRYPDTQAKHRARDVIKQLSEFGPDSITIEPSTKMVSHSFDSMMRPRKFSMPSVARWKSTCARATCILPLNPT